MQEHDDYADRDLRPARVPSLRMLISVLVIFAGLGALAYYLICVTPTYVKH